MREKCSKTSCKVFEYYVFCKNIDFSVTYFVQDYWKNKFNTCKVIFFFHKYKMIKMIKNIRKVFRENMNKLNKLMKQDTMIKLLNCFVFYKLAKERKIFCNFLVLSYVLSSIGTLSFQ